MAPAHDASGPPLDHDVTNLVSLSESSFHPARRLLRAEDLHENCANFTGWGSRKEEIRIGTGYETGQGDDQGRETMGRLTLICYFHLGG